MRTSESVEVAAAPSVVFPVVADLATYPRWLPLVHEAAPEIVEPPAWTIELRAQVGPFARSKRLRMERVETIADQLAVFERCELDGRDHARWALRTELSPSATGTLVTMHLAYDGGLWTGGVLERVLDDQVRAGRDGLHRLLSGEPTR